MNTTGEKKALAELRESSRFWEKCAKKAWQQKLRTEERLCLKHKRAQETLAKWHAQKIAEKQKEKA